MEKDTESRVAQLEERVSYLERELEMNVEEHRFENLVSRLFNANATVETRTGPHGMYAKATEITGDDVQNAIDKIESSRRNVDYAVIEAADGVGMEIWNE